VASGSLITTVSVRVGASGYVIDQLQKLFLVSIAFKLVQRMNNLNKLFKTALYVASRGVIPFSPPVHSHSLRCVCSGPVCPLFSAYSHCGLSFSCSLVSFSSKFLA
jgi:hypothetical protein